MVKLIRNIAGFCFFVICGCNATTAQKACIENVGLSQAVVTAEEAIACSGDKTCIENAAKERALITVEYAKVCIDGTHD